VARLERALRDRPIDLARPPPPPPGRRAAAVLLVVDPFASGLPLLFIQRGSQLSHHPGQVAFPGGAVTADDRTLADTALREAQEEVGVEPRTLRLLGQLPTRPTHVSGFLVTPVVAAGTRRLHPRPDGVEVTRCFGLRLDELLAAAPGERGEPVDGAAAAHPRYQLHGHTVWGVTAGILRDLLERVRATA